MWQVFQEQNKVEVPHNEKEAFQCDIKSVGIQCTYNSTTNSNLRAHNKRVHEEKPTNGNEWQKDDDPKCREETAEYDVAPQQVSLEINILHPASQLNPGVTLLRSRAPLN